VQAIDGRRSLEASAGRTEPGQVGPESESVDRIERRGAATTTMISPGPARRHEAYPSDFPAPPSALAPKCVTYWGLSSLSSVLELDVTGIPQSQPHNHRASLTSVSLAPRRDYIRDTILHCQTTERG